MANKPKHLYLAKTAEFPGYWGTSDRGIMHAIAEACSVGASNQGVFVIYDAYEGCSCGPMGGLNYLKEHGEPEVYGIYDAAGNSLGENLLDAAEQFRKGYITIEDCALSPQSIKRLKEHKAS